jgi:hypothetical protein
VSGYELLLRFANGRDEVRVTDHLDSLMCGPDVIAIGDERWRITGRTAPALPSLAARLVCVPVAKGTGAAPADAMAPARARSRNFLPGHAADDRELPPPPERRPALRVERRRYIRP